MGAKYPLPETLLATSSVQITLYADLKRAIQHVLIEGQAEVEALKVEIYWRTGSLIQSYLTSHPEAATGERNVFERLSIDFNLERSLFYRLLQFAEAYPEGVVTGRLSWSHYRALLTVPNAVKRRKLAKEAARNEWPVLRLRKEVEQYTKMSVVKAPVSGPLIEPARGTQGVRLVKFLTDLDGNERKVIDMGFHNYKALSAREANRLEVGDAATWDKQKVAWAKGREADSVYFYTGVLERVVDGDTFLVHVDLGFGIARRQYLRFRGINTEELGTPRGERARKFLLGMFKDSPALEFKSRFTDKYDRYLSDVWKGSTYLNQILLDKGLADKY